MDALRSTDAESTSGSRDVEPLARAGDVLSGRYRLDAPLGRGAQGEVWRATDLAVRAPVAVKLLRSGAETDPARVRREAAALRLVRVPGVVRLLDEGVEHGRTFIVLDFVDGSPFPGRAPRIPWPDLAPIATALFETLSRVHAAGIVHRDLKPANVLVTSDGRPILLDFGLSRFATPRGDDLTGAGHLIGTPAYLAPEQLLGQPVTARTDLYGAGELLYEALSGRLPHDAADWMSLMRAKLTRAPTPLKDAAPDVPLHVARAVDQLLSRQSSDRPSSAAEALRRLLGEQTPPPADLPWLGPRTDIDFAVREILAGRTVEFAAEPGGGRTRFVHEVSAELRAAGKRPVELAPATRPFASLEPAIGAVDVAATTPLAEVMKEVVRSVNAFYDRGGVLFTDGAGSVDPWSLRALQSAPGSGPVLLVSLSEGQVGAFARPLRLLEEADLRSLFAGPDRLFHLREDASRLLWQRTSGKPRRVADEVAAWVRAGIARPDGAHYRVDRDSLDALEEGLLVAFPPAPDRAPEAALPEHLVTLSAWVGLAGRHATAPFLAELLGEPRWRVEAEMEDLVHRGVARKAADGALVLEHPGAATLLWPVERVRAAHRKIADALPPGAPHRLVHMITAGGATPPEIGREALSAARRLFDEGKTGRAVAVLEEGVRGLRAAEGADILEPLFALWLEIALTETTPKAIDRILYDLNRIPRSTPMLGCIESLARAGVALSADPPRALALCETLPPFESTSLERARRNILVTAARSASESREAAALDDAAAWAEGTQDPEDLAALEMWRGRYCYRAGRFEEAAAHHLRAADAPRATSSRIAARLHAASALIEAFSPREAALVASEAGEAARRSRHVFLEARAEWLLRAATYRLEMDGEPDIDLVDAIATLGVAHLEAPVCLTEATFAYRTGHHAVARKLALQAERLWTQARIHDELALLSHVLAIVCGEPATAEELARIASRAVQCVVPGVGIQILGLARRAGARDEIPASVIPTLLAGIPPRHAGVRMDVLSAREACASAPELAASPP